MPTNKITESTIEQYAIDLLEKQGFTYIYGPDIAPDRDVQVPRAQDGQERPPDRDVQVPRAQDGQERPPDLSACNAQADSENPQRATFEEVILIDRLREAAARINPDIPPDCREDAIKQILRLNSPELITNNETFHRMLTEGIKVTFNKEGTVRGDYVWLFDFNNPDNNDFHVVNQYTVIENNRNKRPDIIIFVNGIPLVVIELKNPADENATVKSAFKQIQTYKQAITRLFTYNGLIIISDGLEAKAGTISAGFTRFMAWKSSDGKVEASPLIGQLETLIKGMVNKETLLDLIRHFVVFEKSKKEDKKTGR